MSLKIVATPSFSSDSSSPTVTHYRIKNSRFTLCGKSAKGRATVTALVIRGGHGILVATPHPSHCVCPDCEEVASGPAIQDDMDVA